MELLVTMAMLAVLTALLLPTLSGVRASAMKVVCASRLRDLTLAANLYRSERGVYPLQVGATNDPASVALGVLPPKPTDMAAGFLNSLQGYLRFPTIDPMLADPDDLPYVVQCPTVEDTDLRDRVTLAGGAMSHRIAYTGYAYCVRPKDGTLAAGVTLLRPDRVAAVNRLDGGVIWADDVHYSAPQREWRFAHGVPKAQRGSRPLTYARSEGLLGQHRAYHDGRVEWVDASQIELDRGGITGAILSSSGPTPTNTKSKASLGLFGQYFFWF